MSVLRFVDGGCHAHQRRGDQIVIKTCRADDDSFGSCPGDDDQRGSDEEEQRYDFDRRCDTCIHHVKFKDYSAQCCDGAETS